MTPEKRHERVLGLKKKKKVSKSTTWGRRARTLQQVKGFPSQEKAEEKVLSLPQVPLVKGGNVWGKINLPSISGKGGKKNACLLTKRGARGGIRMGWRLLGGAGGGANREKEVLHLRRPGQRAKTILTVARHMT